ncbi:MAG TPA: glycine--tRNA ligase [Chthoniobacterales bacterium]|nr:glycine--tRNA ligase [Chthoniobacterales bacterium]
MSAETRTDAQRPPPPSSGAARMERIVRLCKRRGFIFQSAEIYGGLNGVWDMGPLGAELKRNLKDYWWRVMVRERDDVVGLDGSIITHRAVLKASGHEDTFSDPMVECRLTNVRLRADQISEQSGTIYSFYGAFDRGIEEQFIRDFQAGRGPSAISITLEAATVPHPAAAKLAEIQPLLSDSAHRALIERLITEYTPMRKGLAERFSVLCTGKRDLAYALQVAEQFYKKRGVANPHPLLDRWEATTGTRAFNPENGAELGPPRAFNLMLRTQLGATEDESSVAYLRPETAQSIFVQFKNVLDTARKKLPFGIAQIGKAFRNEINPRNFIFRSREFEQMELEYFCAPQRGMQLLDYWLEERLKFYDNIGIPRAKLHVLTVPDADRAFYSKGTYDIEYEFPFGVQELEGVAYRTDYDLTQHQNASGKPLEYFDEESKQKFIPHVVEPSAGVDRTLLALICEAYDEETVTDDKGKSEVRTVMRFHPRMAPIKVGVFPLLKNKPELVAKAREVHALLKPHMMTFYDEGGAIGRRYRRQDEAGTPFGITIDFETLGERGDELRDTVTLRHRDSMQQERVKIGELLGILLPQVT